MSKFTVLLLLLLATTSGMTFAKELSKAEVEHFLKLEFWDFDQTATGWRKLTSNKDTTSEDRLAAAKLCRLYFERRKDVPTSKLAIVAFHAGQNFAFANRSKEALAVFEKSFQQNKPDWNAYVKGTIAFLNQDRSELIRQRAILARIPGQMNLEVLDRLIKNFDKPYAIAY